jgi:hypothetical protein
MAKRKQTSQKHSASETRKEGTHNAGRKTEVLLEKARAAIDTNGKIRKEQANKENRYEYQANVNYVVEVMKDRLIGILIADGRFVRNHLYRELTGEIKRRVVPIRPICHSLNLLTVKGAPSLFGSLV